MSEYKFFIGCNKEFEPDEVVYEISANNVVQTLTSRSALNCGDKFDGGNGVKLYLCNACKDKAYREGYIW